MFIIIFVDYPSKICMQTQCTVRCKIFIRTSIKGVKVWREFGENKKLNFIYILLKFSSTRGLISEGLEDTHSLAFFLVVALLSQGRPGPSCDAHIHSKERMHTCVYSFFAPSLSHVKYKCTVYLTKRKFVFFFYLVDFLRSILIENYK